MNTSSRFTNGAPALAAAALKPVTPGITSRRIPRREALVQVHVGAVEEGVALAQHRHVAAGVEMGGDRLRGAVVELAERRLVAAGVVWSPRS